MLFNDRQDDSPVLGEDRRRRGIPPTSATVDGRLKTATESIICPGLAGCFTDAGIEYSRCSVQRIAGVIGSADNVAHDPALADFHIRALDGRPRDPMCGFFLTRIPGMCRVSMVESGAVDVLGVRRKMARHRIWQIIIGAIRHGGPPVRRRDPVVRQRCGTRLRYCAPHMPHRITIHVFTMCVITA